VWFAQIFYIFLFFQGSGRGYNLGSGGYNFSNNGNGAAPNKVSGNLFVLFD
jgi:hypothetical protein